MVRLPRYLREPVLVRVDKAANPQEPSWRVVVETADGPAPAALLDCVLTASPLSAGRTLLVMQGTGSAAIVSDAAYVPHSLVRLAASACARAFPDHLISACTRHEIAAEHDRTAI